MNADQFSRFLERFGPFRTKFVRNESDQLGLCRKIEVIYPSKPPMPLHSLPFCEQLTGLAVEKVSALVLPCGLQYAAPAYLFFLARSPDCKEPFLMGNRRFCTSTQQPTSGTLRFCIVNDKILLVRRRTKFINRAVLLK